ncbi:uncharacterized protein MONBRDRAFT_6709 [Monosiga brevicollis MX1]|uniref:Uncharacterized protein n=1 Tax=Monosiga brevicollis TaxID=81824 RepID=A9UV26_MONBE|nr:uncharacterized protein MONBRDRAFT_6709 [Monosiga brevicollis MX1]EDQ90819.1 predicted protein [Monosiga brevicollis MX1]|eukprot:XP_001744116.1 hypothetical protein [Monosiga brevicollis MX1]
MAADYTEQAHQRYKELAQELPGLAYRPGAAVKAHSQQDEAAGSHLFATVRHFPRVKGRAAASSQLTQSTFMREVLNKSPAGDAAETVDVAAETPPVPIAATTPGDSSTAHHNTELPAPSDFALAMVTYKRLDLLARHWIRIRARDAAVLGLSRRQRLWQRRHDQPNQTSRAVRVTAVDVNSAVQLAKRVPAPLQETSNRHTGRCAAVSSLLGLDPVDLESQNPEEIDSHWEGFESSGSDAPDRGTSPGIAADVQPSARPHESRMSIFRLFAAVDGATARLQASMERRLGDAARSSSEESADTDELWARVGGRPDSPPPLKQHRRRRHTSRRKGTTRTESDSDSDSQSDSDSSSNDDDDDDDSVSQCEEDQGDEAVEGSAWPGAIHTSTATTPKRSRLAVGRRTGAPVGGAARKSPRTAHGAGLPSPKRKKQSTARRPTATASSKPKRTTRRASAAQRPNYNEMSDSQSSDVSLNLHMFD